MPVPKVSILERVDIPFFEQKFKDFQGHISHFSRTSFSAKKGLESMSFLLLPKNEQYNYPYGLLVFAGFRIKLALKFKDFPAQTVNFKDFQGLEFLF